MVAAVPTPTIWRTTRSDFVHVCLWITCPWCTVYRVPPSTTSVCSPLHYSQGEFWNEVEMAYTIVEFLILLLNICLRGPISAGCQNFYPVAFFGRHPMDIWRFFLHFSMFMSPQYWARFLLYSQPHPKKKPLDKKFGTRRKLTPSDP